MTKVDTYNTQGKKAGTVELPERIFALTWNDALMHQAVTTMQANARTDVAHTKDRSDVRGGGKKPWRQKGTGRARHGSIRSPLWVGGGVTFGPRNEKEYRKRLNKKMRTKALYMALSRKCAEGDVLFIDALSFNGPKAKEAKEVLVSLAHVSGFAGLAQKRRSNVLIIVPERSADVVKSFSNFGNVEVEEARNVNPVDVLTYQHTIIVDPAAVIAVLESRGGSRSAAKSEATPAVATK